jgi:uncharacterized membrane protein YgcG
MKSGLRRYILCLFLLLPLLTVGHVLAQTPEDERTELPLPLAPVVTLNSDVDENDVEQGNFTITSPNTTQFDDAESVDWLVVNADTRDQQEGSLTPANAGTITINATDLGYADGHIVSFSMVQVAALDDEDYINSQRLIFCYPVHEDCADPETLVRALPPPLNATITLVPADEAISQADAQAEDQAEAQTSEAGGTFEINVPLPGSVINNADGFGWTAENSDGTSGSGTENLDDPDAQTQAQTVDPSETIRFGTDLIDFQPGEVVRITLTTLAEDDDSHYVDSHPVIYYYCQDPDDPAPDCEAAWNEATSGNTGGSGGDGGGGDSSSGGGGITGTCLNTDAAAPIKVCANDDYTSYTLYGIIDADNSVSLVSVSSSSVLSDSGAAANSNLASGTNSAADQPYTVSYDGAGIMTLSTFYADKGPDVDKPYIITIDTHNTVRYVQW